MIMECSICLNTIRATRTTKELVCGHTYHGACIDSWILSGGRSCPLCRNHIPSVETLYKMTITIENLSTGQVEARDIVAQNAIRAVIEELELIEPFEQAEILFPTTSNIQNLESVARDFGFHIDPSVFNTE